MGIALFFFHLLKSPVPACPLPGASLTAFLDVLDPPPPRCLHSTQSQSRRSRSTGTAPELFMAPQLSKAIATDALLGHGAGLFVLCSKPADLEECEVLLKRSWASWDVMGCDDEGRRREKR